MEMNIKSYSELILFVTFDERLNYLKLFSKPGDITFGHDRYINQILYNSYEWKYKVRPKIIIRDNGCDLGIYDQEIIKEPVIIHHINPITVEDIKERSSKVFDPENLICCRKSTHEYIHFGINTKCPYGLIERLPNDTCPWKK